MVRALPLAFLLLLAGCGPDEFVPPRTPTVVSRAEELRPTDTSVSQMWKFAATDVVERFDSPDGGFRVHYTQTAGANAVPTADTDMNMVPDLVETVADVYDEVGGFYADTLGLRRPLGDLNVAGNNGGDGRFDVYLLDFALSADGAFRIDECLNTNPSRCAGYVVQENDFVGYGYPSARVATRILGSHEYFHAIQSAYDGDQDVVFSEGTAVWGSEQFDSALDDLEGFAGGYLSRTDRSLDSPPPGPVPSFAYGTGVFFEFLSEKYDAALIRKLLERVENGQGHPSEPQDQANPHWLVQLDAILKADYQSSFAQAFAEFAKWNLYAGSAADSQVAYRAGAQLPQPAMTSVSPPYEEVPMRVYYASVQYFRLAAMGRPELTAALVDDPNTADDERDGMALILAARSAGGRNTDVRTVGELSGGAEHVPTPTGTDLIIAVVNGARAGTGGILSKRPFLCAGSPQEVDSCRIGLNPSLDAGVPELDAGVTETDGGTEPPPPPPDGCGCSAGTGLSAVWLLLLGLGLATLRRRL